MPSAHSATVGTVIGWGSVDWAGLTPPTTLTNAMAVTVGEENCLALMGDGTVVGWGNGNDLGAASPPAGLSNVVAIASGAVHSLALTADGRIVGWGDNYNGQIAIPSGLTNAVAIAAGDYHNIALSLDHKVWAWGAVGLDPSPVNVPPGLTNVIAVAAGGNHSLAVRADGTVVAWGADDSGQCDVPPGLTGVVAVAATASASMALQNNGNVVAWGNNATNYPAGLSNIVLLATGCEAAHFLALRQDGFVLGWGDNNFGPLNGPAPYTNLISIAAGYGVSFGITREPVITQQPAATGGLASTNLTLKVTAVSAVPWSYQWLRGSTNLIGQTNSALVLNNVQVSDSDNYSVLVSNQYGAVLSSPAAVNVQPFPPSVTAQPTNNVLLAGTTSQFAVSAIGAPPLAYQWYFNHGMISGATNTALVLTNVSDANAGTYQVVVLNAYGTASSAQVTLTVNDPPTVTSSPVVLTLPAGTNWIIGALATGTPPLFYQWLFQSGGIPGATNLSYVLANIQPVNAGNYALRVSNSFGAVTNTLYSISVTDSPPVIYQQPVGGLFPVGGTVTVPVSAYGSTPLYAQWSFGNSPLVGATNLTLHLVNLQMTNAGSYFLTISNSFGTTTSATINLSAGNPYPGQVDWPSLTFTPLITNAFSRPVRIANAADGSGRLFVLEQLSRVWIIKSNTLVSTPFLDLSSRTNILQLSSLAFPPGFATNGHFYLFYARKPDGAAVISRFQLTSNSNVADTNSEEVVLTIPKQTNWVAYIIAGQMCFGPDGFLYVGAGDSGWPTNSQYSKSLLGKLLRIDVENGVSPYGVPAGNPFAADTNYAPEIWALGLRNPWTFSFDRGTGDLYLGDDGSSYHEINYQSGGPNGGQNYGWPIMDGLGVYAPPSGFTNYSTLTQPVTSYNNWLGLGVRAGYVYRGPGQPRMTGMFFFGDFYSYRIWGMAPTATNWPTFQFGQTPYAISAFGEDEQGGLYLADYNGGIIYQMTDSSIVATPLMSPNGGTFNNDQSVTVSTMTPGAAIHYTTDSRNPTEIDPAVASGSSILVGAGMTLKIQAYRAGLTASSVVAADFSFQALAPTFTPGNGPITNGTLVSIASATTGTVLHYTLDGSDPGGSSPVYSVPLLLNGNATLRAIAMKPGYAPSSITTVSFGWTAVPTPELSPVAGAVITNGTLAVITCALSGAEIHYSTDGTVPTLTSPRYTGPFLVVGNSVLNAAAWAQNYAPSQVSTANYALLNYRPTVVQTYSGQLQAGYADAPRLQARFNGPQGVCVDSSGNVYVADTGNNVIREILNSGQVVTVAGSGAPGSTDGVGTNATFSGPTGVALDRAGNLYVADSGHNLLRKIQPGGVVTTFANLAASPAQLPVLWQSVVDTNGVIYVSGWLQVFAVNSNGTFSSFAGPGYCCPPNWSSHIGLALDGHGGLFATINSSYGRIVELSPNGGYSIYAGDAPGYTDGPRQIARFQNPLDVASYSDGALIVSDWTRIRCISTNGIVSTLAGTGQSGFQNGPGFQAAFSQLGGIAVDSLGNIYVADSGNNCIRRISSDTYQIGIPDWWQLAHFGYVGIDPNADPDHDGMSNFAEFFAGTDPNDPKSCLRFTAIQNRFNGVLLNWSGGANSFECLQRCGALGGTNVWQDIFTNPPSTSPDSSYMDASATNGPYLYRIRAGWQ